jgi:hypothetical protein
LPTVAGDVAVLAAQFTAFVARGCVITAAQIATQFTVIMSDLRAIMANVPVQGPIAIVGQRRDGGHRN